MRGWTPTVLNTLQRWPRGRGSAAERLVGPPGCCSTWMEALRDRLRAALVAAMKAQDSTAVAALRSALGAIDNAEAVEVGRSPAPSEGPIAGAVEGLGAGDVVRRALTEAEMAAIVRREISDRESGAREYERLARNHEAARLRAEAAVLTAHIGSA